MSSDANKFEKVKQELDYAYSRLKGIRKGVNIFGSARNELDEKYLDMAEETAYRLAMKGFTIITGGGPGVMQSANKGAFRAGKTSVGLNIELPFEQESNEYITELINFKYFYTRKVSFAISSFATVTFPGAIGTLDEFFEILTLLQTKKIKPRPFVLVDSIYYKNLLNLLDDMIKAKTMGKEDKELITVANTVEEVINAIVGGYKLIKNKKYI